MAKVDFNAKVHANNSIESMGSIRLKLTLILSDKSLNLVYAQGQYVNCCLEKLTLQSKSITIMISKSSNFSL